MKETKIILNTVERIKDFVGEVILTDFDVDLVQGRYIINARSIMGIFSLDTNSPITVRAYTENADAFFAKIAKFGA